MALECNLSNSFLNREQRMVVHVASLLLTDDRGLDMRELAKSFGIPANDIERIYDCALVIYDIAGNQGETLVKLPESAVDRCMEMAALRVQLGKMVAKLFPGKPQIETYPRTPPSVERRASCGAPASPHVSAPAVLSWLFPLALCGGVLWANRHGSAWLTFVWLLVAWNVGRFGPALLLMVLKGKNKMKTLNAIICAAALLLACGCTVPCYERTVVKTYDGSGILQSAVVTEHVRQADPHARPLLDVLEVQTYDKKP